MAVIINIFICEAVFACPGAKSIFCYPDNIARYFPSRFQGLQGAESLWICGNKFVARYFISELYQNTSIGFAPPKFAQSKNRLEIKTVKYYYV